MSRFIVSPQAQSDIAEILDFLADEGLAVLEQYEAKFEEAFHLIAQMPLLGHTRPGFEDLPVRVWVVRPYLVVYLPGSRPVEIVAVLHGARDVDEVMPDRFPST